MLENKKTVGGHRCRVAMRVYANTKQGGRNYMEDFVRIKIEDPSCSAGEFAYFGVFDGHGGPEAARFAQATLGAEISRQMGTWMEDDEATVIKRIKQAFIDTHHLMNQFVDSWPKTMSGQPSTSGTTASVVLIRGDRLYVAHVGDSAVVLGESDDVQSISSTSGQPVTESVTEKTWRGRYLTTDHKPDSPVERHRIEENGGQVMMKAGVHRVVWQRPRIRGAHRLSTGATGGKSQLFDTIPFLAVARALGDLWSYNMEQNVYVVSPEPDVSVHHLDATRHQCLILASDGVWNMVTAKEAVQTVQYCVEQFAIINSHENGIDKKVVEDSYHPATHLVDLALERWSAHRMRADNTSAIVVLFHDATDNDSMTFHPDSLTDYSSDTSGQTIDYNCQNFASLVASTNHISSIASVLPVAQTSCLKRIELSRLNKDKITNSVSENSRIFIPPHSNSSRVLSSFMHTSVIAQSATSFKIDEPLTSLENRDESNISVPGENLQSQITAHNTAVSMQQSHFPIVCPSSLVSSEDGLLDNLHSNTSHRSLENGFVAESELHSTVVVNDTEISKKSFDTSKKFNEIERSLSDTGALWSDAVDGHLVGSVAETYCRFNDDINETNGPLTEVDREIEIFEEIKQNDVSRSKLTGSGNNYEQNADHIKLQTTGITNKLDDKHNVLQSTFSTILKTAIMAGKDFDCSKSHRIVCSAIPRVEKNVDLQTDKRVVVLKKADINSGRTDTSNLAQNLSKASANEDIEVIFPNVSPMLPVHEFRNKRKASQEGMQLGVKRKKSLNGTLRKTINVKRACYFTRCHMQRIRIKQT